MEQLFKQRRLWSTGCASFYIRHKVGRWYLSVAVKCQIGTLDISDFVLLDTGADRSVIGGEMAILLENELGPPIDSFSMSTRFGRIFGSLHHIPICLTAKQGCGNDLTVESSVFVSEEWENRFSISVWLNSSDNKIRDVADSVFFSLKKCPGFRNRRSYIFRKRKRFFAALRMTSKTQNDIEKLN